MIFNLLGAVGLLLYAGLVLVSWYVGEPERAGRIIDLAFLSGISGLAWLSLAGRDKT